MKHNFSSVHLFDKLANAEAFFTSLSNATKHIFVCSEILILIVINYNRMITEVQQGQRALYFIVAFNKLTQGLSVLTSSPILALADTDRIYRWLPAI